MKKNSVFSFLLSVGVLCQIMLCAVLGYAQQGKINAKVIDAKTKEPILRATVQIVETKQGAFTKDNGVATIINIPPGMYSLVAKFAGYKPQTIDRVKVQSDITTTLEFALSTTEQKEVIVKAEKLVEVTETKQSKRYDSSSIANVPGRQNLDALIALTPAVVRDANNGGFSVNGSRGTSNSNKINGLETTDIVDGSTNAIQQTLSKFAVSELSVTTSGSDASNGNTTGGVFSTTTKGGGESFEFLFHYRQEIPGLFGTSGNGFKQQAQNSRIYEAAFGGPVTEDLKYFITTKLETRDFNNISTVTGANGGLGVLDPYGNNLGQLPNNNYFGRNASAKISFNVLGFTAQADAIVSSYSAQSNSFGFRYGDQTQLPAENNIEQLYTLNAKTQIGEGLAEFTVGYDALNDRFGKYDYATGGGLFDLYKIYDPKDEYTWDDITGTLTPGPDGIMDIYAPVSKQIPNPQDPATPITLNGAGLNPFTGKIEGGGVSYTTNNPYGLLNQFYSVGNPSGYFFDARNHVQIDGKYSEQISEHFINFGFEAQLHHITTLQNQLPWDPNPFQDQYDVRPKLGALYVIDKMEFSDITFNPSLRFDYYDPANDKSLVDPYNPLDSNGNPRFEKAPIQTQLSPRLGITYAVSEQTTFNFNYGLYFKQPLLGEVLTNTGGDFTKVLQRGNQIIGNGALKAERSTEIVVGFTTALTDVLRMDIQGVYKDLRNQSGLQRISSDYLATGYTLYADDQYGNSKSIQLSLEKRMRDNYSVRFNYTLSAAVGTSSSSTENYSRLINTSSNAETSVLPLQPYPLSFDRPQVAQLIFNVAWSKNEGPTIFGAKILQLFNLSFTTIYQSGIPYTRTDSKGNQTGEYNGAREPSVFQTDASLSRSIPLSDLFGSSMGSTAIDLQLEIVNLFNRNEPISVYSATGQGDDDGQTNNYTGSVVFKNDPTNADGQQLDYVGNLKYNARWDLNKDGQVDLSEQQSAYTQLRKDTFARRANYQIPRLAYFNVTFRF
jgi:hypothetical protein